jgi:uncharacterized protein
VIHQVVLKVASRCNLNCAYCYIYNAEDQTFRSQPPRISDEVYDALLTRIAEYSQRRPGHSVAICFHGGEPTLLGVRRFCALVKRARRALGATLRCIAIQTNGTLIDENWARALGDLEVVVSVSLDGPAQVHNAGRVDHRGQGSHASVIKGIQVLQRFNIPVNILCVVNPYASGLQVYRYLRSLSIDEMDFLLPDVSHDNKDRIYSGLGPTPVADYLLPILDDWFREDDPNVRIRIFWGLFAQLLGGKPHTDGFGGNGSGYVIVETNGSIEVNDALRVCYDGVGKSGLNVLQHGFDMLDDAPESITQLMKGSLPLPTACRDCPERSVCGGGYLPHRYSREKGFDNPSVWCSDILQILRCMRSYVKQYENCVAAN